MSFKYNKEDYITSIKELEQYFELTPEEESQLEKVIKIHPMKISKQYLSLINKDDKNDPLIKTFVPSTEELIVSGEYDTSGEQENTKVPGLQHKYSQTALLLATNNCFSYCRFCFRKRLVGLPNKEVLHRLDDAVNYVQEHKEINNVLISGGDPLTLPNKVLGKFLERFSQIKHLDFIRIGTRAHVSSLERILDSELLDLFKEYSKKKTIYLVSHFEHPREITEGTKKATSKFLESGVVTNNQTVLLKGINNEPSVLAELMEKLVSIRINPYYVFQCRPVKRVKHHFQVPLVKGYEIVEEAKSNLNGHSKRFKYVMSHKTGKIEIVGVLGDEIYFKYHQAKNPEDSGRFFKKKIKENASWLDELD